MGVADNKDRLDNHAERLRNLEIVVGRNGLVRKSECAERHTTLEGRMDRVEKQTSSMGARLWALLVLALTIAVKLWLG